MRSSDVQALSVGDGYLLTWTVRAFLLVGMHRAGVTRLRGEGDITLREFAHAFPDSKQWFSRLRTRGQHNTLSDFVVSLRETGIVLHVCMFIVEPRSGC
jgi:hypothetical protein